MNIDTKMTSIFVTMKKTALSGDIKNTAEEVIGLVNKFPKSVIINVVADEVDAILKDTLKKQIPCIYERTIESVDLPETTVSPTETTAEPTVPLILSDQCRQSCPEINSFWQSGNTCPEHCVPEDQPRHRRNAEECTTMTKESAIVLANGCKSEKMKLTECSGMCQNNQIFDNELGRSQSRKSFNLCEVASTTSKSVEFFCGYGGRITETFSKNILMVV